VTARWGHLNISRKATPALDLASSASMGGLPQKLSCVVSSRHSVSWEQWLGTRQRRDPSDSRVVVPVRLVATKARIGPVHSPMAGGLWPPNAGYLPMQLGCLLPGDGTTRLAVGGRPTEVNQLARFAAEKRIRKGCAAQRESRFHVPTNCQSQTSACATSVRATNE
jgi:hypothetical protein